MISFLRGVFSIRSMLAGAVLLAMIVGAGMVVMLVADQSQDRPDSNVKVIDFWPRDNVQLTGPANITVKFSRDMMPAESLNILTADIPLVFDPPLSGLARWIGRDELRFFPDSTFRPSTLYSARVKSDRTYIYGNRINEKQVFTFRTPTFSVHEAYTEIINIPEPPFESQVLIHMRFNCPVDPQDLLKYLTATLAGKNGKIAFEITDAAPSEFITLKSQPFRQQDINGQFDLVIAKGLHCQGGQVPLQADYLHTFKVPKPEPLVVNSAYPENAGPNSRIIINLSQQAALSEIRKFIAITPSIDYAIDQYWGGIQLIGNFKPKETYTVNIKQGLQSLNGQTLERDFSTIVQIGDLQPGIKFIDNGLYMSQKSRRLLAVETTNINEITVEVEQVFPNNIVYYLGGYRGGYDDYYYGNDISRVGRRIFFKDFKLNSTQNVPLTSTVDLGQIVGDTLQGIYKVAIREKERRWTGDQRQVMISDLGILARLSDNYLMVWVNSLANKTPVSGAEIVLISRNNQALLSGKTDSRGAAIFENIADKAAGFEPFVITVTKGHDLSYLQFSECMIYTGDFDISGRPYVSKGQEAFIYSDRGVYRPGETVHLVSVVRGPGGGLTREFPYILSVKDPQGRDFKDFKLSTKDAGFSALDIDIPTFAKTGGYLVTAKIGELNFGQYAFQVEEFMPDRIKTTVATDKGTYQSGDEAKITVTGAYLFGPPAEGNSVSGHITIESDFFQPSGWSEYSFYNPQIQFSPIQYDLPDDKLDEQGNRIYSYKISSNMKPPSSLRMQVSATVREDGGRAVSAYKSAAVNPYPFYLGLKQNFDGYAQIDQQVSFSAVAIDGAGKATNADSAWMKFYRVVYQTILKKDKNGIYRYVSEEQDQIIDSTLASISTRPATVTFAPPDYGAYRVMLESSRTGHSSSITFYTSGWGYTPWSMANPDKIELELDKKLYKPGEKAKLLVKAPFAGKLLLTIEKDKVLEIKTYDLDSNTAEIKLETKQEFAPNVYITATLIKSTTSLERFSPARAFGMVPLMVENFSRGVHLEISAPDVMRPRQRLDIRIKADTRRGARITVAAVDVGILQLTDFKTPNPFEFFYGKKRPSLQPYDIYSLIFPDIPEAESKLSPAGSSAFDAARKRHLNPINVRRVKPVALWSGVLITDDAGNASVSFDVPQFNGKLLVMAVAFAGERAGSGSAEVTVRDKVIIQESLPRFITGGDRIKTGAVVFNNTGQTDSFGVAMNITGPATLKSAEQVWLTIKDNGKAVADFTFTADNTPGKVVFDITAGDGGEQSKETVELANRPALPILTMSGSGTVKAGAPVKVNLPTNWLEGTDQYELKLAATPTVRLTSSIQYLLKYPYGCVEQTTSKLFPLLYFNDLARFVEPALLGSKGKDYFIAEGVLKLSSMQTPSGAFTFWLGDSNVKPWGSIYASHFLVEARKAGYQVGDNVYDKMIDNLQRISKDPTGGDGREILRIYASFVLAKAGKLDRSVLNSLKQLDTRILPIYSQMQLAGAIAMTTGAQDALWLLPAQIHPQKFEPETGGFFNSDVRTNAIILEILSEIAPENPGIPELIKEISDNVCIDNWYTTQSTAFALLAIGKYFSAQEQPNYTGAVVVGGRKLKQFGTEDAAIKGQNIAGKDIEISINGQGTCYYYWQSSGISTDLTAKEFDNRLKVRREYLDSDGKPLDLKSVKLGDQIVAKVTAEALDKPLEYVAINDLLPSCLEIENPRLATTGRLNWLPQGTSAPSYMDIRDDRMLLFTDLYPGNRFVYYYSLRVISRGSFVVPPVAAECMYNPIIASAGSSGDMMVGESK